MPSVYLDACIVIHLIEGNEQQQQALKQALLGKTIFSSELVRLESRIKALREDQADFLMLYERFFNDCRMIPMDRVVFDQASHLRVTCRLKTPDALHVAAALQADCEQFWTNDLRLVTAVNAQFQKEEKALKIVVLADIYGLEDML